MASPTLHGYILELEAALGREWSAADMTRTMNRVQGVFKNVGAATNDALSDQVREEMVHLNAIQNEAVSEILLKYYKMILQAMPATEVDPPVVDFDMDMDIDNDYFSEDEDEEEQEQDSICVVCQENIYEGVCQESIYEVEVIIVISTLHCGHKFHKDCITEWLRRGSKFCPLCKAAVVLKI